MKILNITYKFNDTNVLSVDERLQIIQDRIEGNNIIICSEFYLCELEGLEGKVTYIDATRETVIKAQL
jgi:hypothetical protein